MTEAEKQLKIVGRAENVAFPECNLHDVPARIDTGATTSAVWASGMQVKDGLLSFVFFDKQSPLYNGERHEITDFEEIVVASSNGTTQRRYKVQLLVKLKGKKVRAAFTLANRATQVYPVLVGRNVLLGKFLVDVKKGHTQYGAEVARREQLQTQLDQDRSKS
jgi:hypothetical protein